MKLSDFLSLSTRALTTKTSRTFLTILGMGVGIGAVLFLVSLGYGMQKVLIEEITTAKSLVTLDVTYGGTELVKLNKENIEEIKTVPGIKEVSPIREIPVQVNLNELTGEIMAMSIRASFFDLSGLESKWGENFQQDEIDKIVISDSIATLFEDAPEAIVGKKIKFSFYVPDKEESVKKIEKTFEISGVLENQDESIAFINDDNFKDYDIGDYSMVKVETESSEVVRAVRQHLMNQGFTVSAISDTVDQANKIFKAITVILAFFGIIALIVSAIGMFNTMTITLLERTQEIGVMKSIGASNGDITKLFITESTIMGFLGSIVGIFTGIIASEAFNFGLNILASNMGGEPIDLFYSPRWFILFILVFGSVIGLLTGIFPARRAGKIDSLEALRYK